MSTDNKWKPDFKKWYEVNKDASKLIFEQSEKKMQDVLSESESITDKSIMSSIKDVESGNTSSTTPSTTTSNESDKPYSKKK